MAQLVSVLLLIVAIYSTAEARVHEEPCFEPADYCRRAGHGGFTFSPDGCNTCRCTLKGQLDSCTMMMCPRDMTDQVWSNFCAEIRRKAEEPIPVDTGLEAEAL